MKGALLKLMNQGATLAPSTGQSSAGDRLDPFSLHAVLMLLQSLAVGQGGRAGRGTECSQHPQNTFYLVGLLFFFSFFFFFYHYVLAKVKLPHKKKNNHERRRPFSREILVLSH